MSSNDVKIVYNECFGGFSLSKKALEMYKELSGKSLDIYGDISRHDPILVHVVETLGEDAGDRYSRLAITSVPEGTLYRIDEYDGRESVETVDTYTWTLATNATEGTNRE